MRIAGRVGGGCGAHGGGLGHGGRLDRGGVEVTATHRAVGPAAMTVQTASRDRRTRRRIASSRAPAAIGAAASLCEACLAGDMVKLPGQDGCC
ncbi:hypothetical protein GCM10010350_74150 [Streptomyces galilaeus]|nr:hypothetical protein GCM10010350_74150 [Streptomyces galilaeus]